MDDRISAAALLMKGKAGDLEVIMSKVVRIYVEKKTGFDVEANGTKKDLKESLHIAGIENLRIIHVYDIEGMDEGEMEPVKNEVLSEPNVDDVYDTLPELTADDKAFRVRLLTGQFDQRADSAEQCIELLTMKERPTVQASTIYIISGKVSEAEFESIKTYLINPVESCEVALDVPAKLAEEAPVPEAVRVLEGFNTLSTEDLAAFRAEQGFAMTLQDLAHCQAYFKNEANRVPTITELKVIDTYWSDHCRHTTFMTEFSEVAIEDHVLTEPVKASFERYKAMRDALGRTEKPMCLMDLATIEMRQQVADGRLADMEVTEEINACSIEAEVDVDGVGVPYLIMFKNETHNHPTEIEPYGGASTCLGGAIRDPLSGRSYVYHSMRLTGAADPRTPIEETLAGKLPQKKITQEAALGFSGYGNQIGLATGHVAEVYDPDFVAKRMEVGAVVGAAPKSNVVRLSPVDGDIIVMVGGRTGRDGIGGATGSSKVQTEESIHTAGAEVQKGNPPEERKIQRLFRNPLASQLIKKSNDFGAGGVSVAIGELADSIDINLDTVPVKYSGLDGTELAISESQERMAVVLSPENVDKFIRLAEEENLEAVVAAKVTDTGRLRMFWKGDAIFDIERAFLDTNGVRGEMPIKVAGPKAETTYFEDNTAFEGASFLDKLNTALSDLNIASQKGLVEHFDSTIGTNTVLMPFGGKYQATPAQGMAAKVPVFGKETTTGTVMTYGYDPKIGKWSPFHGGYYSVIQAVAKAVAVGAGYKGLRLSMQEYFERLGENPEKWGKPFSALLGALQAQEDFEVPAIGGKDSMSGTFNEIDVPPTAITFALKVVDIRNVISQELKSADSKLVAFMPKRSANETYDVAELKAGYDKILSAMAADEVRAAMAVEYGGIASALAKMTLGNRIGVQINDSVDVETLFRPELGGILLEVSKDADLSGAEFIEIGKTTFDKLFIYKNEKCTLEDLYKTWAAPLDKIFPEHMPETGEALKVSYDKGCFSVAKNKIAKPKVFVPVFPGTNCEYDTISAFEKAGAAVESIVLRNLTPQAIAESIDAFEKAILSSQIIALPGGFSAGDEPAGSGKFIASVFRNPKLAEAIMKHLNENDGLMLGICNGFQALVKLGLLPYGDIRTLKDNSPTLTFNTIGRHVSRMADVRVASNLSPWLNLTEVDSVYSTAFSHGEGRFVCDNETFKRLTDNGQIATQYVDPEGNPTMDGRYNINGSVNAIEGITSADGRILGKMGHVERIGNGLYRNIPGAKDMMLFEAGVRYFKG